MKLTQNEKIDIQMFVYFLFKGTLDHSLIIDYPNYTEKITDNPSLALNCFKMFAQSMNNGKQYSEAANDVAKLIFEKSEYQESELKNFWHNFIEIAAVFCENKFKKSPKKFKFEDLNGVGSTAIPYFAVWTNVIEVDINYNCLNSTFAAQRANESLLLWDGVDNLNFTEEELHQELH